MEVWFRHAVDPHRNILLTGHLYSDCTFAGPSPLTYEVVPESSAGIAFVRLRLESGRFSRYSVLVCRVCTYRQEREQGLPNTEDTNMKFELYKDAKGEFRWRIRAGNNRIIGASGEGYTNKTDCLDAIDRIKEAATDATVQDESKGDPATA